MPLVRPLDWTELKKLCESEGCKFDRQKGSHYIMTKEGLQRPVVIPKRRGLKEDIVLSIGKTLGLTRDQILERVDVKRAKAKKRSASS